jgi:queuosine precursor transporter
MFESNAQNDLKYKKRREYVFVILAGLFLGTLAMLNVLGISRLLDLSFQFFGQTIHFYIFVGVLPYPITFLCTDLISEIYGKKRATMVVWVGFILNLWVLFIMWLGGVLPPQPEILVETGLPAAEDPNRLFFELRKLTFGATAASMIAYLSAQFVDVHVFHFLRRLTRGKYLWIRNNFSTLTSQMVDSLAVVLITYYYTHAIRIPEDKGVFETLVILILSNYFFKMLAALADTLPFYAGVRLLTRYLKIDNLAEFRQGQPQDG